MLSSGRNTRGELHHVPSLQFSFLTLQQAAQTQEILSSTNSSLQGYSLGSCDNNGKEDPEKCMKASPCSDAQPKLVKLRNCTVL